MLTDPRPVALGRVGPTDEHLPASDERPGSTEDPPGRLQRVRHDRPQRMSRNRRLDDRRPRLDDLERVVERKTVENGLPEDLPEVVDVRGEREIEVDSDHPRR